MTEPGRRTGRLADARRTMKVTILYDGVEDEAKAEAERNGESFPLV